MAGTNKKKSQFFFDPVIILKNPQLPENIGMVARTMVNFGFKNLRIIAPKIKWPNNKSFATSAGAFELIGKYTRVFNNLEEAIKDINLLCAATIRFRDIEKKMTGPRQIVRTINLKHKNKNVGFLFGAEKAGLSNKDIAEANLIVKIPSNIGFGSLNLAMAVNIICYEWFILNYKQKNSFNSTSNNYAELEKVNYFKNYLLNTLKKVGFYENIKEKEKLITNVKNLVANAHFSEKDLKILYGIVKSLINYKINN